MGMYCDGLDDNAVERKAYDLCVAGVGWIFRRDGRHAVCRRWPHNPRTVRSEAMGKPLNHVDDGNCGCMQCQADEQAWDDEDLSEHCDHEDYDADILTGVATCGLCGARWHQTSEEIAREREAQKHYDEFCADLSQER